MSRIIRSPLGVSLPVEVLGAVRLIGLVVIMLASLLAVASLTARFRRGGRRARDACPRTR